MKPFIKRVRRGEIYWCDLGEAVGSEQGGIRPVIIVQNDIGNNYSTTTIVVPVTTKIKKTKLPTHHEFENNDVKQIACAEQIRTVDKMRLGACLGFVGKEDVDQISQCVHIAVEEIKFLPRQYRRSNTVPWKEKGAWEEERGYQRVIQRQKSTKKQDDSTEEVVKPSFKVREVDGTQREESQGLRMKKRKTYHYKKHQESDVNKKKKD